MGIWDDGEQTPDSNGADVVRALDSAQLHDVLVACVARGWYVALAGSRDRYSVQLSVIIDGQREGKWHVSTESLERALERLLRAAGGASGPEAQEVAKKPPRGRKAPGA